MSSAPTFTLNTGAKIPSVGLGVWMGSFGNEERAEAMCKKALKVGYRAIDTAAGYGNEAAVGRAVRESGIPRSEIFVTTKLGNGFHDKVQEGFEASLKALDIDYIDLYLMHWPQAVVDGQVLQPDEHPTIVDTWKDMEKLLQTGKVKAIGVSNFDVKKLQRLIDECTVVPAANQIELHPCLPQFEVADFCKKHNIQVTAYSSLGQPGGKRFSDSNAVQNPLFSSEIIQAIASKHNANVGQVLLSWAVQRGVNVIPKSESEERLRANITLVPLNEDDMTLLNNFHKGEGLHRSLLTYHDEKLGGVFGYTYEQLGWPMVKGGFVRQ
ncbi:aado/keto reductase [Auricularia subglabra TFB-10046 SS5]|nr:aado/keto reductase [Auricularia subglabra TFB-10046 SS5]